MTPTSVLEVLPLGFPWATLDPFLFCVHHKDAYPKGNGAMGPHGGVGGRSLGMDFEGKDGWRMYHGMTVPGFPQHPHRGFETITVMRDGTVDHADSLGAKARLGPGDVQWMTAGKGIVHSEMFPLLHDDKDNPLELFQIWINLPAKNKMVEPHFTMLWAESVPTVVVSDENGKETSVVVVAGRCRDAVAPSPPPSSWAAEPHADVNIWSMKMAPGAQFDIPATDESKTRVLYFFSGHGLRIDDQEIPDAHLVQLTPKRAAHLVAGADGAELLLLEGRPIGEPVAQHGPFVMNTREEIVAAFAEYRRTQFGGWPWRSEAPVHDKTESRFAIHPGGRRDAPKAR